MKEISSGTEAPPSGSISLQKVEKGTQGSHSDGSCTLHVYAKSEPDVCAKFDLPIDCCGEAPEVVSERGWVLVRCVVCRKAVMTGGDGVRVWNQMGGM